MINFIKSKKMTKATSLLIKIEYRENIPINPVNIIISQK